MAKRILGWVVAGYLLIGLVLGLVVSVAIPAVNVLGVGYYALTWPLHVAHGSGLTEWQPPIPDWVFSFK